MPIKKILDNYSLEFKMLNTGTIESRFYSKILNSGECDSAISVLNVLPASYDVHHILFKANTDLGFKTIELFYNFLINNNPNFVYVEYTNVMSPDHCRRIVQNVWQFKNYRLVRKWLPKMRKDAATNGTRYTHIAKLPKKINSKHPTSGFKDFYWDRDRLDYVNKYVRNHAEEYHMLKLLQIQHALKVQKISSEEITAIAKLPNRSELFTAMINYNNDVQLFINKRQASNLDNKAVVKELKREQRGLSDRFFELHTEDMRSINLNKKREEQLKDKQ